MQCLYSQTLCIPNFLLFIFKILTYLCNYLCIHLFFTYIFINLFISLIIYSLTIHFCLHPFLFNLSITPSCRVFSSINLKILFSKCKPITSSAVVFLEYVAAGKIISFFLVFVLKLAETVLIR